MPRQTGSEGLEPYLRTILGDLRPGLLALLRARHFAADIDVPLREFAVHIRSLRDLGMVETDFHWLIAKQFLEHSGALRHSNNCSGKAMPLCQRLPDDVYFVLTVRGLELVRSLVEATSIPRPPRTSRGHGKVPEWDARLRELRLGGKLVKRFRVPAPTQELVLSAFQEEGWPPHIDDPLPPAKDITKKERLHDTIQSLNRCQQQRRIRFRGNGKANAVLWELTVTRKPRGSTKSG